MQVGDPFMEKLLLEACLELFETRRAWSGSRTWAPPGSPRRRSRWPAAPGSGIELDLDQVPRRETGMTPYEILLSESQERMLLVARADREDEVARASATSGTSTPR